MFEKMKSPVTGALLLASSLAGEELPEVLVEANRIETRREETGSAVTVLSGDWLRDVGIRDLDRSFDTVPGALMFRKGGVLGRLVLYVCEALSLTMCRSWWMGSGSTMRI